VRIGYFLNAKIYIVIVWTTIAKNLCSASVLCDIESVLTVLLWHHIVDLITTILTYILSCLQKQCSLHGATSDQACFDCLIVDLLSHS
jgi:hypothetical protein